MSAEKKVERKVKLKIEGLSKSFRSKVVLQELDLEVFNNESMVVLGGSGTGKSVLIKTIVGLISPDAGTIKLDDDDITSISGKGRDNLMSRFGFLFQGGALFDGLAVWENISFFLTHNKYISKQEAQEVAEKKLKEVGLDSSVMYLHPSELSGGMQKRVALARAIAGDPEIIFFDEPTTGLDPIMGNVINDLINKCRKKLGSTTITITHDIDSARKIASRVAMLYQGKIIWVGNVDEIDDSGNPVFDQFIKGKVEGPIKL